jgi:hypothetical protein
MALQEYDGLTKQATDSVIGGAMGRGGVLDQLEFLFFVPNDKRVDP